jgi:hypothetical protein
VDAVQWVCFNVSRCESIMCVITETWGKGFRGVATCSPDKRIIDVYNICSSHVGEKRGAVVMEH